MQPAFFDDGQTLSSTHYHVDAGFWKGDTFIDGATFLVPSKLPEVGLECYLVDLDEVTGVHHVVLQKASLRTILPLTNLSNPGFSSHVVGISNGESQIVSRVNCATTRPKRKTRKMPPREYEWDSSIAQPRLVPNIVHQIQFGMFGHDSEINNVEPAGDQVANNQPRLASPSVSASHDIISNGPNPTTFGLATSANGPAPIGDPVANDHIYQSDKPGFILPKVFPNLIVATSRAPDDSITGSGRVVGQLPADDRSSLSNFRESLMHIVPRNTTASTSIDAENSHAPVQAQEPVETAVDVQASDISSIPGRSSTGGQGNGTRTSPVPTSPSPSTFSTLPFWKSALANLPKIPIAPGRPTDVIGALALEKSKKDGPEQTDVLDKTILRRLSWDLRISYRQLIHWDEIQSGRSASREEVSAFGSDLVMTEDGQVVLAEDERNNFQDSLTSPQLTSKSIEALPSFHGNKICLSQRVDALDIVRIELEGQKNSRLFYLDLVLEAKGKQRVMDTPKSKQFLPVRDGIDLEIAADSASGKLYLRPRVIAPAVVIQSISATTATYAATGTSLPAQQPSSDSAGQPTRLEDIDLTAAFGQGATDLDDEEEYTAPSAIDYHLIGSRLAKTRYIPSDYADYVEQTIQAQPVLPRIVVEVNEYWNFIKETIDGTWYATGCPKGFLPRRTFCENDSNAVFRELLGLGSKPKVLVEKPQDLRVEFPVHHFNLIGQPVFQDSRNPSAVSYWAAMASYWKKQIKDGISWKAVVSSQAAKWVDPCTLDPGVQIPDDLRARENSTALRNFATGLTTIRYEPWGTWVSDGYDPDQEIPEVMSAEVREAMSSASLLTNTFQGLQQPHFMTVEDGDINVNDDGTATAYPSLKLREERTWETSESRGSTNLRLVDDGTRAAYSCKGMEESRVCEVLKKYETADILVVDLPFKAKPKLAVEKIPFEGDDDDENEDIPSEAETEVNENLAVDQEPVHYVNTSTSLMVIKSPVAEEPVETLVQATVEKKAKWLVRRLYKQFAREVVEKSAEGSEKLQAPERLKCFLDSNIDEGSAHINKIKNNSHLFASNVEEKDSDTVSVAGAEQDNEDHSSTWAKRPNPADHQQAKFLSEFADDAPRYLSKPQIPSHGAEVESKAASSQKRVSSRECMNAQCRLAYWSSSPRDIMRGECDDNCDAGSGKEQHPDLDGESPDMIPDSAEGFNLAYAAELTIVDPNFDEYVTNLLGSGALAQKFMSGQGVLPRTTSRMTTLLGPGAVEKLMDGYGIPPPRQGMMTFLGTGAEPAVAHGETRAAAESHSRSVSSSSSGAGSAETGSTHTRNTSVTNPSSSPSEVASTENGTAATRDTSPSEAVKLEDEWKQETALHDAARLKGYAASWVGQHESPVEIPVVLEAAAPRDALAPPSMEHEAAEGGSEKSAVILDEEEDGEVDTAGYLLVVAFIVAFFWTLAW